MVCLVVWLRTRHAQPLLPNPPHPKHLGASWEHAPCPHPIQTQARSMFYVVHLQKFPYQPKIEHDPYPNDRRVNDRELHRRQQHQTPRPHTNPKSFVLHDPNQLASIQDQFRVQNDSAHQNEFSMHDPCMPYARDQKTPLR